MPNPESPKAQIAAALGWRFWSQVEFTEACWNWTGSQNGTGYGRFWDGTNTYAHRWSYEFCVGPIPDGLQIDHLCRNRGCVNPEHLEAVTPQTNTLRGVGLTAQNAVKTHCVRGHPYNEANTYYEKKGRQCRVCTKLRSRVKRAKQRERAAALKGDADA